MPGAGFFEAAAAAASIVLPASQEAVLGLAGVTIPATLALQFKARLLLEVLVDCQAGGVEVATSAGSRRQVHCRGTLCQPGTSESRGAAYIFQRIASGFQLLDTAKSGSNQMLRLKWLMKVFWWEMNIAVPEVNLR